MTRIQITNCPACGARIVYLKTELGRATVPVDIDSLTDSNRSGDDLWYDPARHRSHWESCPMAEEFRQRKGMR